MAAVTMIQDVIMRNHSGMLMFGIVHKGETPGALYARPATILKSGQTWFGAGSRVGVRAGIRDHLCISSTRLPCWCHGVGGVVHASALVQPGRVRNFCESVALATPPMNDLPTEWRPSEKFSTAWTERPKRSAGETEVELIPSIDISDAGVRVPFAVTPVRRQGHYMYGRATHFLAFTITYLRTCSLMHSSYKFV